ncbi:glucose-6-phosphatase a, catalytic subunit, tandem duplicate 1 [Clarias gariepinus]|uniref:glucose-6-phosphatase a, catalytic subunit, tandem duplicate 1 n=1 Tax=Clarias gariepinus TaxID=13013 RepID=UPI00234C5B96|nr:glucose-6-phosphatase a, catalytic subunit, tandem duplicate 1 [Clarias gariepinus]
MDLLHSWGVSLAVYLQKEYIAYDSWFQLISYGADLHTTFFIFFPIWFHLKRDVGIKLIWVGVVGDWLNLVLKWVLFGERPYWWVHETRFYGTDPAPALRQLPITCETGPGSPSGHAMGSAAVGYAMVTSMLSIAAQRKPSALHYWLLQVGLWTLLGLVELLVCMSRVYVAAHFPHQVICGVISGITVAEIFSRQQWIYKTRLHRYFSISLFLLVFAVGLYVLLKAVGVDLLWTLEKAQKWCVNPTWVHLDTTPFASLMRNVGSLFGLGLGLHSPLYTKSTSASFRMGCISISLVLLQLLDFLSFPSDNHIIFYILSFTKSAVALLVPTILVPRCLSFLVQENKIEKAL